MQLRQSKRNYLYILLGIAALFLLARFLFVGNTFRNIGSALEPLGIAVLIIYLLSPIVNRMEKKLHWPRLLCLCLTYILFIVLLFLLFYFLLPDLIQNIADALPDSYEEFIQLVSTHPFFGRFLSEETLRALLDKFSLPAPDDLPALLSYSSHLMDGLSGSVRWIGMFLIALTMAFYGILSTRSLGEAAGNFLYQTLPVSVSDRILSFLYILDRALRDFIVSKLFTCAILGILVYLGILLCNWILGLHIPYPLLQALITAFFNLIPYIGPFLGTIPCLLLALFVGWPETIALLAILLLMQQVDNMVLEPRIISGSVGVSPFWVLASVTCLGLVFGVFASIFAIPAAAVCQTLLQQYREARLLRRRGEPDTVFLRTVPRAWQQKRPFGDKDP